MHKINLIHKNPADCHVILPCYQEDLKKGWLLAHTGFSVIEDFKADYNEVYTLLNPVNGKKLIIAGLGSRKKSENITQAIKKAATHATKLKGQAVLEASELPLDAFEQAVMGVHLAMYILNHFKAETHSITLRVFSVYTNQTTLRINFLKVQAIAAACHNAMDLVNLPPNIKTPHYLADYAKKSGKENGFKVRILEGEALKTNKLSASYEVGKGSAHPPSFIIMEYKPSNVNSKTKKIGFIGKGITFDTGGISLKPSNNMHYMKSDMAGAAAVIGIMEAAAQLQLPFHIIGIVPAAENAIGGKAYRPGDVISSYSGKHIEVIDTDAEGRLVLADGLSYMVKNYAPDYLIDLATLTGSCVATLGYFAAGMFTDNEKLANEIYQSGLASGEKVWRLPLWDEYKPYMNSDIADIKNLSSVPVAGATTAAKFLEFFTHEHKAWVHLDIAGVCFTESDFIKSRTATGYGIRLLTAWLLSKA
ncbi:MAG: leucyl aminopeptidase family protein [Saprospiraceae bacterium]|nr:leucyl aminopeptidase family protein [Saprospiraceae bacterium]